MKEDWMIAQDQSKYAAMMSCVFGAAPDTLGPEDFDEKHETLFAVFEEQEPRDFFAANPVYLECATSTYISKKSGKLNRNVYFAPLEVDAE